MAKGNEIALSGEIEVGKIRRLQKRIDANSDIVNSL